MSTETKYLHHFMQTLVLLVVFAVLVQPLRASYTITTVDPTGSTGTFSNGCANDAVVGFYSDANFVFHGFLFSAGNYTTIDPPGSSFTSVNAISGSNLVGYFRDGSGTTHGFLYNGTTYTTLDAPGAIYTNATACAGSTVVGNYEDDSGVSHGFRYVSGAFTTIDPAGSTDTTVTGCSGSNIAGFYTDASSVSHGFLYKGTTYTIIDPTGSTNTGVSGCSGNVVAGSFTDNAGTHGFTYSAGTYTTLDFPSSTGTRASDISGINVTGFYTDANGTHGFVYDGTNYTTLDLPGTVNTFATGISGATVAGYYEDSGGTNHGFIATIPTAATVTLSNLSVTYDGNAHAATVTTTPMGVNLSVNYTNESDESSSSTPPTNAGTYDVAATIIDPAFQGSAAGTLVIAPVSQTVTFTTATTALAGDTVTLNGTASSGLPVTYSFSPTDPTVETADSATLSSNALTFTGAGTVTVYAFQPGDANHTAAATVSQTITSFLPANVTLGNLTATFDGSPQPVSVVTNPSGLDVNVTYQPLNGAVTTTPPSALGFYTVVATVDDPMYVGMSTATLVITQPSAITKQPISQSVIPGKTVTFTATSSGFPVPSLQWQVSTDGGLTFQDIVGETSSSLTFTAEASDNGNVYQAVFNNIAGTNTSSDAVLTVGASTKPKATVKLSGLAATYDGTAKAITATTTPGGLAVVITYDGSTTPPIEAGSHAIIATVADDTYQGSVKGTFVISKASATVTLGNLAVVYSGNAQAPTATTSPPGLAVAFKYGLSTTSPTNAGSYAVTATVNDTNYSGTATGTFVISKAPVTVTLGNLAETYTGKTQTASAEAAPVAAPVTLTYNGKTTVPVNAGSYTVVGTVSTTNTLGSSTGTLVISPASATVTLGNLAAVYTGTPHAATATTVPSKIAVSFTYDGNAIAPTLVGSYAVTGTISNPNYTGSASDTLVISPVLPLATTGLATSVGANMATLNSTINPKGDQTTVVYQYGTTTAYGLTANGPTLAAGTASVTAATPVSGLSPQTLYHFRVMATNSAGTVNGLDKTFTTLAQPVFSSNAMAFLAASGAEVSQSVTPSGVATSVYFQFGTTTDYGSQTATQAIGSGSSPVTVYALFPDLAPNTTYHYRLVTVSVAGTFDGPDETFTTLGFDTTLVAAQGDAAADLANATFSAFGNPIVNQQDAVAFAATLTGSGVTLATNRGIFADDNGGTLHAIAQIGVVGGAPLATGTGTFFALGDPIYNNSEAVAFSGTLKVATGIATATTDLGIWSTSSGALALVARQGSQAPGCATGVNFSAFNSVGLSETGAVVQATLANNASLGVTAANNFGIWEGNSFADLALVLRLGDTVGGKTISKLTLFSTQASVAGQTRNFATNTGDLVAGAAFTDKTTGIIDVIAGTENLVVSSGDIAPGASGATYSAFNMPIINTNDDIAFAATLTTATGLVTATTNVGIWADDNVGTLGLIARTGDIAPGTAAGFVTLGDPVYNNNEAVAFTGTLKVAAGQATATTASGIWSNSTGTLGLVAQQGGQAPGCPTGATFASFTALALPDQGGVSFLGKLNVNAAAAVTASNNVGIWAVDNTGTLQLIVRTGDILNGKTVTALTFLPSATVLNGQSRSFAQANGDLVYLATFSDKSTAIFNVVFP